MDRVLSGCCGLEASRREEDPSEWHCTASLSNLRLADELAGRDALRRSSGHSEVAEMETTAGAIVREEPVGAAGKGPPARATDEETPAREPALGQPPGPTLWSTAESHPDSGHHTSWTV